jgi:hypothetical protein
MAEEAEIVTHPIASHQSGAIVKFDEQKGQRPRFFFFFFSNYARRYLTVVS